MQEHALIHRCRNGDREALHELYARTVQRVHRLLLRMTRDEDDAADLTQDTYVRAFTHLCEFRGGSSIETWLYRIAANEALQFLRRAKTDRARLNHRARTAAAPEAAARSSDARLDVAAALAELDPADRLVLLLRYDQGLDYRAIAAVLECAEGTVASRLNRARARLRELLGSDYRGPEESAIREHPTKGRHPAAVPIVPSPSAPPGRLPGAATQWSETER